MKFRHRSLWHTTFQVLLLCLDSSPSVSFWPMWWAVPTMAPSIPTSGHTSLCNPHPSSVDGHCDWVLTCRLIDEKSVTSTPSLSPLFILSLCLSVPLSLSLSPLPPYVSVSLSVCLSLICMYVLLGHRAGHFKICLNEGLPWWSSGKESALQCRGHGLDPWSGN